MNKTTMKFVLSLLSVLMVLSFMPVMSFAAEAVEGGHEHSEYGDFTDFETVEADAEGLEVLVEPTCTREGIGVISCDLELNDEVCGFKKTVWIEALGHKAGSLKRTTAIDVMRHIGYNQDRIDYFFQRNGGQYAYCQCYVYECEKCGEYVDENGRVINAMWTNGNNPNPPAPVVCPVANDRVPEHTKPENTPKCQRFYTCAECGYDKCVNDEYDPDYHNPETTTPADKKLTVTQENAHSIGENTYVKIVKWTCGLCNETGIVPAELVGYTDWSEVTHPSVKRVVTREATCAAAGEFAMVCNECGHITSTGPIQKLEHEFETVTPFEPKATDVFDDGTAVDPEDYDTDRYVFTAEVCKNCGQIKKDPGIQKVGFAPTPAEAEISYSPFTEATCEQGSWMKVSVKNGELIVDTYLSDSLIEILIGEGFIEKVGDKYYTRDKIEVPYTPALKHDFGAIEKVAEATCEEAALEGKKCTKCGKVDHNYGVHEVGSPLGHDIKTYTVAPTCGEEGYTYDTCDRCKLYINHTTKKANGYGEDNFMDAYDIKAPVVAKGTPCQFEWKVTKAPTATEDGEKAMVCKVCGAIKEGSQTVVPRDSDEAKDVAIEAATPAIEAAAAVLSDKANYTADSVKAIEEAKAMLNQAIASGSAADVTRCAQALQKAVDAAAKKEANPMTAKAKTVKAKAKKTTKIAAKKAFTVKKAQGKVTYKKKSGNGKIKVASNGKVTVKKGLKKGKTYKVKVTVKAAGNDNYLAKSKVVTLKVKITK